MRARLGRWAIAALGLLPASLVAQDVPVPADDAPVPVIVFGQPVPEVPSPTGAFLRALAVPGWGHAAIGSYGRGAFYAAVQSGTAYALVRTSLRLSEARERASLREQVLRRAYESEGLPPDEVQARLEADPALTDIEGLVSARESQREDWIALGIFVVLLSAADAYVSSHLAHFPEPIVVGAGPGGGVDVAFRISLPRP